MYQAIMTAVVEQNILDICAKHEVELIVLAKYMQILTDNFVSHYLIKLLIYTILSYHHLLEQIHTNKLGNAA